MMPLHLNMLLPRRKWIPGAGPAKWLFVLLLVFLVMYAAQSSGQSGVEDPLFGGTTDSSGTTTRNPDAESVSLGVVTDIVAFLPGMLNNIFGTAFIERIVTVALQFSSSLTEYALMLAGVLAVASGLWQIIINMLEKKGFGSVIAETMLYTAVTALLIGSYEMLIGVIRSVAQMGMNVAGGTPGDAFMNFIYAIFRPFGQIWDSVIASTGGIFSGGITSGLMGTLIVVVLLAYAVISLLGASKEILGVFIMGPFFLGVGIVFGPLMIATIASSWTRKWFEQWINFLVGSAFLTVVATVLLSLVAAVLSTIGFAQMGALQSIAAAVGIAIMADGLAKLFSAVPAMTDAIFPGRTGAGAGIQSNMAGAVMTAGAMGAVGGFVAGKAGVGAATSGVVSGVHAAGAAVQAMKGMYAAASSAGRGASGLDKVSAMAKAAPGVVQDSVKDAFHATEQDRYDKWFKDRG